MALTQEQINKTFELMQDRSEAPKLTPEQLNAIDLLILGKTDREVAETVGVRRETVTKWHKNPFFSAELSARREELWVDAKLRLKALAQEAVDVLKRGLSSDDVKVAITSAVHILKTVGLYGDAKQDFGPDTPEEAVWKQTVEWKTRNYMALRPDAFSDWPERNHMSDLAKEDASGMMRYWYDRAVDDQKTEIRQYKRRLKAHIQVEPVPQTSEEDLPQDQDDRPEAIEAQ